MITIQCAAVKYTAKKNITFSVSENVQPEIILFGHRHPSVKESAKKIIPNLHYYNSVDGFMGSDGLFYDRVEAYQIAIKAYQITDDGGAKILVSEMLY